MFTEKNELTLKVTLFKMCLKTMTNSHWKAKEATYMNRELEES